MDYLYIRQRYGLNANEEDVIKCIQAELEKRVSAYLARKSKKISPIRAKLFILRNATRIEGSTVSDAEDVYDNIIVSRAKKSSMRAYNAAMEKYKSYTASIESHIKKEEKRSDFQYRLYLLNFGAARNLDARRYSETINFTSQVYIDYMQTTEKEVNNEN